MSTESVVGRSIALAWIFSAVTAGVVLSSCATSGDLRELGYTVDKRLSLAEAEIAELHTDAADRAEVERRFSEAREEFEEDVEKVAQSTEARAESMAGTLSRAVGLPEAIGIAIASMVATWLGRDWTRKRTIQKLHGETH